LLRKAHVLAWNSLAGAAGGGLPEHRWVQDKLIRAVRLVARAWRDARALGTAAPGTATPGATAPGYPGGRVVLPPLGVADGFGYQREMEGLLRSLVGSPTVYVALVRQWSRLVVRAVLLGKGDRAGRLGVLAEADRLVRQAGMVASNPRVRLRRWRRGGGGGGRGAG